ncbi:ABC transporter substrate-binding protein [Geodermatophilus sabuli]|uniref:ABC transporter substrate-binding protein n=1 Tax=Geodermatophilus sabuli TaxID=1564158 RepID=A0A7K3VXN5_9ACTN|nr:ABC transporter substrate-binding protein [Geodermatophilus sabuli]
MLTASVSLVLAACGGSDEPETPAASGSSSSAAAEPVTVEVGVIPVIDVAVLYLGQEQGFFEDRGITLNFNTGQGGAALVPSVVSGDYQFAFSNVISVMQAREQGLPLQVIAPAASSTGNPDFGINSIMVIDPAIQDAGDLVGRRVGVNTLNNLSEVVLKVSVEAAGGDPEGVQLVELSFPDQVTALSSGDIDAFVCAEPFCSIAEDAGARVIANPYDDLAPGEQIASSAYFSTEQAINEDPDLFARLQEAIAESQEFAQENPDEIRAQLPNFTTLDPALIETLRLPQFNGTLQPEELQGLADASVKYGILTEEPVLDEVVWTPDD